MLFNLFISNKFHFCKKIKYLFGSWGVAPLLYSAHRDPVKVRALLAGEADARLEGVGEVAHAKAVVWKQRKKRNEKIYKVAKNDQKHEGKTFTG